MKVRFSSDAQADIAGQIAFLKGKTNQGIATFRNIVSRGRALIATNPEAGLTDSKIPIRGARRVIVDGWYFDYEIIGGDIWVLRITSSINTPSLKYDDDYDYEDQGD